MTGHGENDYEVVACRRVVAASGLATNNRHHNLPTSKLLTSFLTEPKRGSTRFVTKKWEVVYWPVKYIVTVHGRHSIEARRQLGTREGFCVVKLPYPGNDFLFLKYVEDLGLVLVDLSPELSCEIHTCEFDYEEDSYVRDPESEDEDESG